MKPQYPLFDPREGTLEKFVIWIKISGLPLEFQIIASINSIGDIAGKTLVMDKSFLTLTQCLVAKVFCGY